jgi:Domain of unknown function (DUF5655)
VNTIEQHFAGREPHVRRIYDALLRAARAFGPFEEQPKKTSIHLARKTAFAGVSTRKDAVIVTIKVAGDIDDPRVVKHQHASANRWYLDVRLGALKEVDAQLTSWMKSAYELSG